jgi:hypothetical protein
MECPLEVKPPLGKKFCCFIYSNNSTGHGASLRKQLFETLSKYKKVDSFGQVCNNMYVLSRKDEPRVIMDYKFYIAYENSGAEGYITEKIIKAYTYGCIPIYWGDPLVESYFNPESFINANKFKSVTELIDKIKEIDQNDELYQHMLNVPKLQKQMINIIPFDQHFKNFLDLWKTNNPNLIEWQSDLIHKKPYQSVREELINQFSL